MWDLKKNKNNDNKNDLQMLLKFNLDSIKVLKELTVPYNKEN